MPKYQTGRSGLAFGSAEMEGFDDAALDACDFSNSTTESGGDSQGGFLILFGRFFFFSRRSRDWASVSYTHLTLPTILLV